LSGKITDFEHARAEAFASMLTQAGLAAGRRAGRTGGRPPKLTDDDIEAAKAMLANPDIGVTQIAHRLGVSPATLYRYIPGVRTANIRGV
jgi:DNA invertase Pin-like site-specific DNA recombinase